MSNNQNLLVVPSLIAQVGIGEDTYGLIGKKVRVTTDPAEGLPDFLREMLGAPPDLRGDVATVIHIGEDGEIWADFGDNEKIRPTGPEQVRVIGLGYYEDDEDEDFERHFEVIED